MDEQYLDGDEIGGSTSSPQNPFQQQQVPGNRQFPGSNRQPVTPGTRRSTDFVSRKLIEARKANQPGTGFESDDPDKIMQGMTVEHQRFGEGKVLKIEGGTPNKKATVFFKNAGQKQLLLKFAKLKIKG
jgi:DNA helicase-2/ATP-dependent DNA helicase PcrA